MSENDSDSISMGESPAISQGVRDGPERERPSAKRGRPRGARSMGRYPWLNVAEEYLAKRRGFLAKSTYEEWERKMRYTNRVLVKLRAQGKVSTTSPYDLKQEDISAYLEWARAKGIQSSTLEKYLFLMAKLCAYAGNPVFERMKAAGESLPRKAPKDLHSLSPEDMERITNKASEIEGWYGDVCRFIVAMYPYSGLRPSELRLAQIDDLDTKRWRIWVRHPKGEGKYGRQRHAPILPPARQAVLEFLKCREERLRKLGVAKATPLIPARHQGGVGFYSQTRFRGLKAMLELPDVPFSLKTFRDTFCQMNIDLDPNLLSDISVSMGHTTTKTTEQHYGRIKTDQALDRLQTAWEKRSDPAPALSAEIAKKGLIEKKFDVSGYA
jgi:integrase/recombinase XerD